MKIGVVGATGMVGEEFLKLLAQRNFPVTELRLFASDRSEGQHVAFRGQKIPILTLKPTSFDGLQLVFFSSGEEISKEWAPIAIHAGAFAVDNSSAFRMSDQILLCVPEVNGDELPKANSPQIIANPNCSTIQLVVALKPLCDRFGVSRVNVATYQAVSGAGKAAREELLEQSRGGVSSPKVFSQPIAYNCLPQIGSFSADGFCGEETKIMRETKKILNDAELKISAWTVRVPALNSHSEACWITLKTPVSKSDIISALEVAPGLKVMPESKDYPTALAASGTDDVYVGRIHQDLDSPDTWLMWIVADNIRKGAALNGLQIAERIFK